MRDVEKQRCIHSSFASGVVASSTCVSPHASHSKVYRSGSPPNRSVFRMSRIGRAQPMHRGRFNAILSERSLNTETSGSPIGFQQETRPQSDMRLQHYGHVAGGLIVGNEARVSRTTAVNGSFCRADFGSVRTDASHRSAAPADSHARTLLVTIPRRRLATLRLAQPCDLHVGAI